MKKRVVGLMVVFLLIGLKPMGVTFSEQKQEGATATKELKEEIERSQQRSKWLETYIESVETQSKEKEKTILSLEKKNRKLEKTNEVLDKDQAVLEAKQRRLNKEKSQLEKEVKELRKHKNKFEKKLEQAMLLKQIAEGEKKRDERQLRKECIAMRYKLALVYQKTARYKEAEKEYMKVLSFDPNNSAAHYNLGILYDDHLRNNKKAVHHYQQYVKFSPDAKDVSLVKEWILKIQNKK